MLMNQASQLRSEKLTADDSKSINIGNDDGALILGRCVIDMIQRIFKTAFMMIFEKAKP